MANTPHLPIVVLVADDGEATRERLCALLAEEGQVQALGCSSDPWEVLGLAAWTHPRCVVIDVPTRGPEGFALVTNLRRLSASCVIVVLTNHLETAIERRSLEAGASHFLPKAREFERLVDLVRPLREATR